MQKKYQQRDYNLAICIPCQDNIKTDFSYSLLQLQKTLLQSNIKNNIFFQKGSILPEQREILLERALNENSTHIMWIDSDMTFPCDIFKRLSKHNVDIVACNYYKRDSSKSTTAFIKKQNDIERVELHKTGLIEIDACGMGIMLVKADIFDILPKPRFQFSWNNELEYYNGEDIYFCCLAKSYGYKIWVDRDTSNLIGHIGEIVYK